MYTTMNYISEVAEALKLEIKIHWSQQAITIDLLRSIHWFSFLRKRKFSRFKRLIIGNIPLKYIILFQNRGRLLEDKCHIRR